MPLHRRDGGARVSSEYSARPLSEGVHHGFRAAFIALAHTEMSHEEVCKVVPEQKLTEIMRPSMQTAADVGCGGGSFPSIYIANNGM